MKNFFCVESLAPLPSPVENTLCKTLLNGDSVSRCVVSILFGFNVLLYLSYLWLINFHLYRLSEETTSKKKLENALADAHRLLSEKDSCIQDCRITIAQVQNALVETQKERDEIQNNLTNTQIAADTEAKVRKDLEAQCQKANDELAFRKQIYEKVL